MYRVLKLCIALLVFSSCSDEEYTDDAAFSLMRTGLSWSEPDKNASSVSKEYSSTQPMIFHITSNLSFKYRIYIPTNSQTDKTKFPLIIYLHGLDARGTDNSKQMNYAASYFLNFNNQFPAFVIYPQCPTDAYWGLAERPTDFHPEKMLLTPEKSYMSAGLLRLIAESQSVYQIDKERIYIVGHSMGGIGTLDMIASHPDVFAAAISFCGTINPMRFTTNHEVPLMLYHNIDDNIIPVEGSIYTFQRLSWLNNEVIYSEGKSGGHICWSEAVKNTQLLSWLFSHTLSNRMNSD
ncbi:MAG: alpha/beta hydrolase-fold protein [Muribaculaceae bacterium]